MERKLNAFLEQILKAEGTAGRPSFQKLCHIIGVCPSDFGEYVFRTLGFTAEELLYRPAIFPASSMKASESGALPSADGSPLSPLSRMP